jgi:hypothetical protein
MFCCGKKRTEIDGRARSNKSSDEAAHSTSSANTPLRPVIPAHAQFEYTGATALTAVGSITRRRYRFSAPGAIVDVDERDAPSLAAVPHLRRVGRRER